VNGAHYNYAMEVENIDDRLMQKVEGPGNPIGDLFKANGSVSVDDGPWSRADWNPIAVNKSCPMAFTKLQRYQATYERQSHGWKEPTPASHMELIGMIEELATMKATTDNDPKVRAYFEKYFDVPALVTHMALRNWVGVWDDGVHNYFPYKRPSDGKWVLLPQDFDLDFGGDAVDNEWKGFANPPTLSFFHPETASMPAGKTAGSPSQLKVQLMKAFREEIRRRVTELGNTLMTQASIDALLADILEKDFSLADHNAAPVRRCDAMARVEAARTWLAARRAFFAQGVK
jgi:hypothetical protein